MALTLLFDGHCRLCRQAADRVRRWDRDGRIERLDLHDPASRQRFPQLDRAAAMASLHAVDEKGRIFRGVDAWVRLLREIPERRWLGRLLGSRWIHPLSARIYAWIARNRFRWGRNCAGQCENKNGL